MEKKNNYKILIVDDDTFLLGMYGLKFTNNGFEVVTSTSGPDALTKIKDGYVPDVVLMDVIMPVMSGFELVETIKKEKLLEGGLLIMLTNQSSATDQEKAKSLGVHGYIVKATSIPSEVVQAVLKIMKENKR